MFGPCFDQVDVPNRVIGCISDRASRAQTFFARRRIEEFSPDLAPGSAHEVGVDTGEEGFGDLQVEQRPALSLVPAMATAWGNSRPFQNFSPNPTTRRGVLRLADRLMFGAWGTQMA